MFYAVLRAFSEPQDGDKQLVFTDIKDATAALKQYKGSRMKTFETEEKALAFLNNPDNDASFIEASSICEDPGQDLVASIEKLSLKDEGDIQVEEFPSAKPALLSQLRRQIEAGDYDKVEETIWSNPRCLITVCDSATYLMAGPKYNACHIAARANRPDIVALLLDTISNTNFLRKLYPKEPDDNVQDRVNHLMDSYLNTPDPRQGNTPLHYACKLGHHRVVRVLLTFEGCDLNLRNSAGQTAEETICDDPAIRQRIKEMFKTQLHLPLHRDQLKKRLMLAKRQRDSLL